VPAIKETYHPNAYLQHVINVKSGLKARTQILTVLEKQSASAGNVARNNGYSYAAVAHHLRLLEAEGRVSRRGKRPCVWVLTGLGQKRLVS
jgi:DNA-binding transcriptional ArsR family regulator